MNLKNRLFENDSSDTAIASSFNPVEVIVRNMLGMIGFEIRSLQEGNIIALAA